MVIPKRFLTIREKKDGANRRSKSVEPGQKASRGSTELILSIFRSDATKTAKEEQMREKEADKIDDVLRRLREVNPSAPELSHSEIRTSLYSQFADGDIDRTLKYVDLQCKAIQGRIEPHDPNVRMVGAVNRCSVTCYLDALLFAMFARLDSFERMLRADFADNSSRGGLALILRFWVNMLRAGNLICPDLTQLLQDQLVANGWKEAGLLEQQDASEAFSFITETLQLPLLSLQVDLYHHGKQDDDDHKVVYERLLNLAVPQDPDGKGITLEDCLEDYFNVKVDVMRDSQDDKKSSQEIPKSDSRLVLPNKSTIRLVTEDNEVASPEPHIAISPTSLSSGLTSPQSSLAPRTTHPLPSSPSDIGQSSISQSRPSTRHRSTSVIQRILVDEEGRPSQPAHNNPEASDRPARSKSTVVKAVTIPAWQFFRLIPWYSSGHDDPKNDLEVAMNFEKRPVVGICLKRYTFNERHEAIRLNTYVDIPDSLRLPHFILSGEDEPNLGEREIPLSTDYKLVLQSIVCHRGESLESGHYIAFARVTPKILTDNRRHVFDPPPDYEEAQWVRFDDLDVDNRVTYVENIRQCLKEEMPYMLFYQVVPMMDSCNTIYGGRPPSYEDLEKATRTESLDDYFNSTSIGLPPKINNPSLRLSIDGEPLDGSVGASLSMSRRDSIATADLVDDVSTSHSIPPSPAITPVVTPSEESTAQRLSRAAARFARPGKSRPTSQGGETRISTTMRGLGGLMRTSRDPLNDAANKSNASVTESSTNQTQDTLIEQHIIEDGDDGGKGYRRGKSKDKSKAKTAPPERECVVM